MPLCSWRHIPYATYLLSAGHETQHFNVGQYRRKQNDKSEVQDASFFDHNNPVRPHPAAPATAADQAAGWTHTSQSIFLHDRSRDSCCLDFAAGMLSSGQLICTLLSKTLAVFLVPRSLLL